MKQIILSACLITFIACFVSCRKENKDISTSIIGTWELRHSSAAMNPTTNNYPRGNGNLLKFTNDSYEIYKNNQLVQSGYYTIVNDSTVEENVCLVFSAGRFTNRIIYDGNYNDSKQFIEISNNKLTFISGCYALDDGHTSEYEK